MPPPDFSPPLEEILHRVVHRFALLERKWIRENARMGVSDFGVLRSLEATGPVPVSSLGRKLLLTSGSVTTAIDRVERRGLVERTRDPADRRGVRVGLTPAGKEVVAAVLPPYRQAIGQFFGGLGPGEKSHLANLLRKWEKGMPKPAAQGPAVPLNPVSSGFGAVFRG